MLVMALLSLMPTCAEVDDVFGNSVSKLTKSQFVHGEKLDSRCLGVARAKQGTEALPLAIVIEACGVLLYHLACVLSAAHIGSEWVTA